MTSQEPGFRPLVDTIETYSDEELAEHIAHKRRSSGRNDPVIDLCDSYIAKRYDDCDFEDARSAIAKAQSLGLPVPPIKRVVNAGNNIECVQPRICGRNLMDSWGELGIISTMRLALQLRGMVRRMRQVTSATAGSLGTGTCRSMWLEDYFGIPPHASPPVITSILNFWNNAGSFRQEACKTTEQHRETCSQPLDHNPDLVFTHGDLAPRNLLLDGATGKLWVVDWDDAGFYPRYFEYTGMHNFQVPDDWSWLARLRWRFFCWVATGSWARERVILAEAYRKAARFGALRRFSIKSGATISVRSAVDD